MFPLADVKSNVSHWAVSNFLWLHGLYITCQAPLSMKFSRQEYQSVLSFSSPGDLSGLGTEPRSLSLQADTLLFEPPGKPPLSDNSSKFEQNRKGFNPNSFLYWITVDQFITIWLFKYGVDVTKLLEYSGGTCEVFIMKGKIKMRSGFKHQNAQEESKACHLRSVSNYYQFSIWIL